MPQAEAGLGRDLDCAGPRGEGRHSGGPERTARRRVRPTVTRLHLGFGSTGLGPVVRQANRKRDRSVPRICNREGCGKRIVAKDGSPDYRKHFCGAVCFRIDKRERLQAKRAGLENRRCPHCGRRPTVAVTPAVTSEASDLRDTFSRANVKLQHGRRDAPRAAVEDEAKPPFLCR